MNQSLEQLFERVRSWPAEQQDAAENLLKTLEESRDDRYQLTDEQIAEVKHRLADPDPTLLSSDEVRAHFRTHGL